MDADKLKAMIATYYIDRRRALSLRTGNPVHAWNAYRTARQLRVPVPAWVLDCFDTWATVLTETNHTSAKAIADALKIGTKGGPMVTEKAAQDMRDLEIAAEVLDVLDHPTRTEEMKTLAKKFGITVDAIATITNNLMTSMEHVAGRHGLEFVSIRSKYYKIVHPAKKRHRRV